MSFRGRREIGEVIAKAMDVVGKEGVIQVEESNTFGIELETVEGMRFDKGFISPYFVTDPERMEAVMDDAYVLVANQKISAVKDLLPVLEKVMQTGKPVVVIAEDAQEGVCELDSAFRVRSASAVSLPSGATVKDSSLLGCLLRGLEAVGAREDHEVAVCMVALELLAARRRGGAVEVVDRPDRRERQQQAVDLIARDRVGEFVVEHAGRDSFPGQRDEGAWLQQELAPLEAELFGTLGVAGTFRLVVPHGALRGMPEVLGRSC